MRTLRLAVIVSTMLAGLVARRASADGPAPAPITDTATPAPAAAAVTPWPPANDEARVHELEGRLYADQALSVAGGRLLKGNVPVQLGTFYTIVGRPDLAAAVRQRKVAKIVTLSAGAGIAAIGVVWGIGDALATGWDNTVHRTVNLCGTQEVTGECADRSHTSTVPWVVAVGGGLLALASVSVSRDPLSDDEKHALADEHNQRLRAGLGLAGALEVAKQTANVRAAVTPDGQSGMLLAGCSF